MLTAPQIVIVITLVGAGAVLVAGYLAVAARPLTDRQAGGRHVADPGLAVQPPQFLEERPAPPRVRAWGEMPVEMPTARPYAADVPVLVVEGPPGARGMLPADGLPVERRVSCSFCRDGEVAMASRRCAWCGVRPRVRS